MGRGCKWRHIGRPTVRDASLRDAPHYEAGRDWRGRSSLHRALVVEAVLVVLDDGGDGLEAVLVALLHRVLQVEVLDRDVVGAELEVATHRLEARLLDLAA